MNEKKKELTELQQEIQRIGWNVRDTLEIFKKEVGNKKIQYILAIAEHDTEKKTSKIEFAATDGRSPGHNLNIIAKFIQLIAARKIKPIIKPKAPLDTIIH